MHDNVDIRPEDGLPVPVAPAAPAERWYVVGTKGHGDGAAVGAALELERLRDEA